MQRHEYGQTHSETSFTNPLCYTPELWNNSYKGVFTLPLSFSGHQKEKITWMTQWEKLCLNFFNRCFLLRSSNPQDCNFHSSNGAQIPDLGTASQRTCFHSHGLTVTEQLIQDNWHNHSSSSKLPLPHLFSLLPPQSTQGTI